MPKQISDNVVYKATIETLIARGYAGATTKLIAEAAGINEVTLFRKYGNKAQLVAAAVTHESIQFDEDAIVYTGDVAADLLRVAQNYLHSAEKHRQLFPLIMSEMSRYPELEDTLNGPFNVVTQVSALIARYQSEGILYAEHPLHAVGALLGPVIIYTMLKSAQPNLPLPQVDLSAHIARFLEGRALQR